MGSHEPRDVSDEDESEADELTYTMTLLVAVRAGDGDLGGLVLLLLAGLGQVADLVAVAALHLETVHYKACLCKTSEVVFWSLRPALGELGTTRLWSPLEGHDVLQLLLALEVHDRVHVGDRLLLGYQVRVHAGLTERSLEFLEGDIWIGLGVGVDGL